MKRAKIGDIIEIPTALGWIYAQYTHEHRDYCALLCMCTQKFAALLIGN